MREAIQYGTDTWYIIQTAECSRHDSFYILIYEASEYHLMSSFVYFNMLSVTIFANGWENV